MGQMSDYCLSFIICEHYHLAFCGKPGAGMLSINWWCTHLTSVCQLSWAVNTCQFVMPFYFVFILMNWMGPRDRFDMFLCSTQLYLFTCCIWLPVITIWHHNIHVRIILILMHDSRAKAPHPSNLRTQISLSSKSNLRKPQNFLG